MITEQDELQVFETTKRINAMLLHKWRKETIGSEMGTMIGILRNTRSLECYLFARLKEMNIDIDRILGEQDYVKLAKISEMWHEIQEWIAEHEKSHPQYDFMVQLGNVVKHKLAANDYESLCNIYKDFKKYHGRQIVQYQSLGDDNEDVIHTIQEDRPLR